MRCTVGKVLLYLTIAVSASLLGGVDLRGATEDAVTIWGTSEEEYGVVAEQVGEGLIVAGVFFDTQTDGLGDALVLRMDGQGEVEWARRWGPLSVQIEGWQVLPTGETYLSGCTLDSQDPPECADVLMLKLDSAGLVAWARAWDGGGPDDADAIQRDPVSGDLYVTGSTSSYGADEALLLRYDEGADAIVWVKTWARLEAFSSASANNLGIDETGAVVMAGNTWASGETEDALILRCCDGSGNFESARWGDPTQSDDAWTMTVHDSGAAYIAGVTEGLGADGQDVFVARLNGDGSTAWSRLWGGDGDDGTGDVTTDAEGNVYLNGRTNSSFGSGTDDAFLVRFSPDGDLAFSKVWNSSASGSADYFSSVNPHVAGGLLVVGASTGDEGSLQDVAVEPLEDVAVALPLAGTTSNRPAGTLQTLAGTTTEPVECTGAGCGIDVLLLHLDRTCIRLTNGAEPRIDLSEGECADAQTSPAADLIRGEVAALAFLGGSVDLGPVDCVQAGLTVDRFTDLSPRPNAGEPGFFFLAGNPGFGTASDGRPRDQMDPLPPCP